MSFYDLVFYDLVLRGHPEEWDAPDDSEYFSAIAESSFKDLAETFLVRMTEGQWIEIAKGMLKFDEFRRIVYAEIYKNPNAFSDVYEASANVDFFPWYLRVLRDYQPFWEWADTEVRRTYTPECEWD